MDISEKDLDVAAGGQELGELEDGYKLLFGKRQEDHRLQDLTAYVSAVWPACCSGSPVDLEWSVLLERCLHDFWVEHFLQIDLDEVHLLLRRHLRRLIVRTGLILSLL